MNVPEIAYLFEPTENDSPFHWGLRKGWGGFQCNLGWKRLLIDALKNLASKDHNQRFRIAQIKEKFGYLTIYTSITNYDSTKEADVALWEMGNSITSAAATASAHICEYCGMEWTTKIHRPSRWYKAECLFHYLWNKYVNNYKTRAIRYRIEKWCKNHLCMRKR